jgi:hypothetical protein
MGRFPRFPCLCCLSSPASRRRASSSAAPFAPLTNTKAQPVHRRPQQRMGMAHKHLKGPTQPHILRLEGESIICKSRPTPTTPHPSPEPFTRACAPLPQQRAESLPLTLRALFLPSRHGYDGEAVRYCAPQRLIY